MMALQNRVVSSSPVQPKQVAVLYVTTPSEGTAGTSLGSRSMLQCTFVTDQLHSWNLRETRSCYLLHSIPQKLFIIIYKLSFNCASFLELLSVIQATKNVT